MVLSVDKGLWVAKHFPVDNRIGREGIVLLDISNSVQVVSVNIIGGYKKTPRLLQNLVRRLGVQGAIFLARIDVKTKTCSQADRADNWVISSTVLVWHNPYARGVLVDQYVIRTLMWARGEEMARVALAVEGNGQQTRDDGLLQPGGKKGIE